MNFPREAGILLHVTSLPGSYGIGDMGPDARRWIDILAEAGVHLWQILPHGVTGYGDSPYQCFSTYAGHPLWVSFDDLIADGLLKREEVEHYPKFPDLTVDYGNVIPAQFAVLKTVCRAFSRRATTATKEAYEKFCADNAFWLDDFALFMALKEAHDLRPWYTWAKDLVHRDPDALKRARMQFRSAIRAVKSEQFLFDHQWKTLRAYAHAKRVKIVGDIPIFVAHDSADVWVNRDLFYIDEDGHCTAVAGVPPDYFSATGQLWGNPLYRWDVHRNTGYAWWICRMRKILEMVDFVRIDHFRGFEAYWEIPGDAETAINGKWVKGPNHDLFIALEAALGKMPIIAEDLGVITPPVEALRDYFNFPGMRVLQFAFGNDAKAEDYRPHNYPANCVVYTGTHDNDTTVGWFWSEPGKDSTRTKEDIEKERRTILDYVRTDGREIHWDMISLALSSKANTAVFPLQDLLGLGSEARMNIPGTTSNNWRWRFTWDMLAPEIMQRLRGLIEATNRHHA